MMYVVVPSDSEGLFLGAETWLSLLEMEVCTIFCMKPGQSITAVSLKTITVIYKIITFSSQEHHKDHSRITELIVSYL